MTPTINAIHDNGCNFVATITSSATVSPNLNISPINIAAGDNTATFATRNVSHNAKTVFASATAAPPPNNETAAGPPDIPQATAARTKTVSHCRAMAIPTVAHHVASGVLF